MKYVILLLVAGIVFVFLETMLPSGGMLGFLAAAALLAAVILAFMQGGAVGWWIFLIVIVTVPLLIIFGFKLLPRTHFGRRMMLMSPPNQPPDAARAGPATDVEDFGFLKGKNGRTVTELRPSGIAEIEGKRYHVVSRGEMIDLSVDISVREVEGNNIIVVKRTA